VMKNIENYILQIKNLIPEEEKNKLLNELKNTPWTLHKFYNPATSKYEAESGEQELEMTRIPNENTKFLMDSIWNAFYQYINFLDFPWFRGWNGFTQVRFNRYQNNQKMKLHCDHIHDIFDGEKKGIPIMTCLGLLNDDFTGGKFILCDQEIPLLEGDVLVFPSCFLYPHEVTPVISGIRYSFISWAW
jgi:predicted 2-oxoglutarate/Fe(II)-dependent dioxygenase YbiX